MAAVVKRLDTAVAAKDAKRMQTVLDEAAELDMMSSVWSTWKEEVRMGESALATHQV